MFNNTNSNLNRENNNSIFVSLCKFKVLHSVISRENINIYYKKKMQSNIFKLDEQQKKLKDKIEIRKHAIQSIRDDLKKKMQQNLTNKEMIIRNKSYLNMQIASLKFQINSLNMYYATSLNIFRMKLQIEDMSIYSEIHENLRKCVDEMSHYISPDTLRRIEETTSMIEENTDNISEIEKSIQDISNIVTTQSNKTFEYKELLDKTEEEEMMNELYMLLEVDNPNSQKESQSLMKSKIVNQEENSKDELFDDSILISPTVSSNNIKKLEKSRLLNTAN